MKKLLISFIWLSMMVCNLYAQHKADSLIKLLKTAQDSNEVKILNQISEIYSRSEPNKALEYGRKALIRAQQLLLKQQEATAFLNLGNAQYALSNYPDALNELIKALHLYQKLKDTKGEVGSLLNIGMVYYRMNQWKESENYFREGLKIAHQNNDKLNEALALNNLGNVYYASKNFHTALNYYLQALTIREKLKEPVGMSASYNNIGVMYSKLEKYDQALDYFFKAVEIYHLANNTSTLSATYDNIGDVYVKKKEFNRAQIYLKKGLELAQQIHSLNRTQESYQSLAECYETMGDDKRALMYFKQYKLYADSIFNLDKNKQIAEMRTKYESDQKSKENLLLRKDKEIQNAQMEAKNAAFQKQFIILVCIALALLLVMVSVIILYRKNKRVNLLNQQLAEQKDEIQSQSVHLQKANQKIIQINNQLEEEISQQTLRLKQTNQELDVFLYRSSHDLRRPLTTLQGLSGLAKLANSKDELEFLFDKVMQTADSMDKMLRKLIMVSDINHSDNEVGYVNFDSILRNIKETNHQTIQENNINFLVKNENIGLIRSNQLYLQIILENLIENSFDFLNKYHETPTVFIHIFRKDDALHLLIEDNGVGIEEEHLSKVFDMYYRGNEQSKGNGLGLYVTKKAVDKLKGSIALKSNVGEFTRFEIIIPIV